MRSRGFLLALTFVALFAGCVSPAAQVEPAQEPPEERAPVELSPLAFAKPVELGATISANEPSIRMGPNGEVYVVTTEEQFWRSLDGGATFQHMGKPSCFDLVVVLPACAGAVAQRDAGLRGGGDGAIAVSADGTLHWLGLQLGKVIYQRSHDRGETWSDPFQVSGKRNSTDRE